MVSLSKEPVAPKDDDRVVIKEGGVITVSHDGGRVTISGGGSVTVNGVTYVSDEKKKTFRQDPVILSVSYVVYTVGVLALLLGGAAYLIYWKDGGWWWGLLALILCEELTYTPKQWSNMFNNEE